MASGRRYEASFFTATILEWKPLLTNELYKNIITDSIRFLVKENRVQVYAFVIMNNHMHLLWNNLHPHKPEDVQRDFLRYTARMILKDLKNNHPDLLKEFYVGAKDRNYQVWERNPMSIAIWNEEVLKQKMNYIHNNPVKAGLCVNAEDYKYSTAGVYLNMASDWDFITPVYIN